VREHGPSAFGATTVELAVMDRSLGLRVTAVAGPQLEHPEGAHLALDSSSPLARAARTGENQVPSPPNLRTRNCAIPLIAPNGQAVLGALGVSFGKPVDLSKTLPAFLFLAEETAWALERGRLIESERKMRHRAQRSVDVLTRLQAVTAGLLGARHPEDVAEVIVATGVRELKAESGTMYLADPAGPATPILHLGAGAPLDPNEAAGITTVIRTGRPMFVPSPTGDDEDVFQAGLSSGEAMVALPIETQAGSVGAIVFRFRGGREFSELERSVLAALAGQGAQALERAQLYAERTREAHLLQRNLLPAKLPTIPGVETAVRYQPFGDGSIVGGDFYDIFPVDEERWGFTIGDVCGKGIPAASMTALVRHAIRALASSQSSPAQILRRVNDIILQQSIEVTFCTVVQGFLSTSRDRVRLRFAVAGHPRPILVSSSGRLSEVGAAGSLIGAIADPELRDEEVTLAAGEALVLYTDGVMEARSPEELVAPNLIERAIGSAAGRSADDMADAVESAALDHQGGTNRDDMALLVLRVTKPETT
jgi:serine phosphatase RsbU (regulator of sigma subunit)